MRIPPWLCAESHHFRNRNHDCPGPRVSHSAVTNSCLGKRQMIHYGIHVVHLGISVTIKCHHMPAGGTAPPLQSRQVQISSKLCGGKGIGPTCGFAPSPMVGPVATVDMLQIGYPYAQDLSQGPQRQTPPHLARVM
jgi:hypothetical protein